MRFLFTLLSFCAFLSAEKIEVKVLMNAEPFGFGPSAAIAEMVPHLRNRVSTLSFIGSGHTLDLQSKLPYDHVFELVGKAEFEAIAREYDVFITASDFEKAAWAKELGLILIIYDPLTWYWPKLPAVISSADLYIAQNFFGVEERIAAEKDLLPKTIVVPAIVLNTHKCCEQSDLLLTNLGGLNNPYMSQEEILQYAEVLFKVVHASLEPKFEKAAYVTSKSIAQNMQHICPVQTLLPCEVQKTLSAAKLALMTSGLGNLFEASLMQKKVVWMPPANDSQGQQIELLEKHGMIDARVDWSDIFEGEKIDYFAEQQQVLKQISHLMRHLAQEQDAQERFRRALLTACTKVQSVERPALSNLAITFKANGAKLTADAIVQFIR